MRIKNIEGRRPALLVSASIWVIGAATLSAAWPALAETAAPAEATAPAGQIGEVVVTARRTAENLQTTPVSVTAVSGAQAAALNIRNYQDLRGAVPNLEVLPLLSGGANLTIRGIGQASSQVNVDAKTGLYINDFYVARQEGNSLYFYDIDALQVLKGPQGTLFGKNTTAGAFLLTTAKPTADPGGFVDVRAGSYNRIDTEGAINMPLSDNLLTRFSFKTDNADGYIHHLLDDGKSNDVNDKSARFQVQARPTDKLTVDFLAEYNEMATDGTTSIETGCLNTAPYTKNYNALHTVPYCNAYPSLSSRSTVYGGATLSIPTSSALTDVAKGGTTRPAA